MSIEKKLTASTAKLAANLRTIYAPAVEAAPADATEVSIGFDAAHLTALTEGYTTKLSTGTERGVTVEDLEAAANFNRDLFAAHKLVNGEISYDRLGTHEGIDRFGITFAATGALSVSGAVFRPGKELEDGQPDYASITRGFDADETFDAIDKHLKGLRSKFTAK